MYSRNRSDRNGVALTSCSIPDDWLVHNRRPLLLGREALKAVLQQWTEDTGC